MFLHHPLWISSTFLGFSNLKHDLSCDKKAANCADQEYQTISSGENLTQQICHSVNANAESN
jgi:hypothetical protein